MDLGVYAQRPARDDMLESEFEYGPRAGLPRLLSMFDRFVSFLTLALCPPCPGQTDPFLSQTRH
jgi:hypothetical protein